MTGETYKHGYGSIPTGILITILVIAMIAIAAFSLTGNSGDGPPAEAGDSGGGIDPNPAGADPSVATSQVESTKEVEVTLEDWKSNKVYRMAKPGILYVCEDRESNEYRGFIILENSHELKEFDFRGTTVKVQHGRITLENVQSDTPIAGACQPGYLSRLPVIPENIVATSGQGKYVCIELYRTI